MAHPILPIDINLNVTLTYLYCLTIPFSLVLYDYDHFVTTDKLVLLASDGLWDVINPRAACEIALRARREGRSATKV